VHFAEKKKTWRDGTFEDNWYFLKASGLWTRICIDFLNTRKMMRRWLAPADVGAGSMKARP